MKTKVLLLFTLLSISTLFSAPAMLPISIEIMRELKMGYQNDKGERYISQIVSSKNLNYEQEEKLRDLVDRFFESDLFIETGAAYLTALFSEKDLHEIKNALSDGYLRLDDPNYPAARRLQALFNKLDPYILKYLNSHS